MLLGTLGASLLTRGGLFRAGTGNKCNCGQGMYRVGKRLFRAGHGIKKKSLIPFHPLTNFEIQDYLNKEKRFNGIFSRNNLPKTLKKGAYVINLDHSKNTGTH